MSARYCWWEAFLTNHQAFTTAALAQRAATTIDVYCVEAESGIRIQQGWTSTSLPELSVTVFPPNWPRFVWNVLKASRATHVFAGPFGSRRLTLALLMAVALKRRVFILTEPYSPVGESYFGESDRALWGRIKARLRPMLYKLYGLLLRRRTTGVFAISPLAIEQVRRMGFEPAGIHPFGYFVPPPSATPTPAAPLSASLRVVFAGTLSRRKGVDILVQAAELLAARGADVVVDAYGSGDAGSFGLDTKNVKHRGLIPFGEGPSVMRSYDVLVLPSRYDGWGVVVNEAIQAGVPVVASEHAGASAMIRRWGCGIAYRGGARELADVLETLASEPQRLAQMREACARIEPLLDPAVAGQYLHDVLREPDKEILNPWY